ncbi:MAG TPA: hypothetical protein VMG36_02835 [Thermoplasmata archaeon]|nr:hypothetical protein [Thermoplasmata archaeon]
MEPPSTVPPPSTPPPGALELFAPPATERSRRRSRRPRSGTTLARAGVGVALAVVVLAAGFAFVDAAQLRTGCRLGSLVGEFNATAPSQIVNHPGFGVAGFNSFGQNWTFRSGSLVLSGPTLYPGGGGFGLSSGGAGLLVEISEPVWAVYAVKNASTTAAGASPCTQPYVAEVVNATDCPGGFASFAYPLANNTSDAVEPQVFNTSCDGTLGAGVLPGAYVRFHNSYPAGPLTAQNSTELNLCDWTTPFYQPEFGTVYLSVTLEVPLGSQWLRIPGQLWWEAIGGPTAYYDLPAGAIWAVAAIANDSAPAPGLLPSGLLAFEALPC